MTQTKYCYLTKFSYPSISKQFWQFAPQDKLFKDIHLYLSKNAIEKGKEDETFQTNSDGTA